ncbi:MAG: universal stress protein [Rhizobiaceae bacterium]
MIRKILVPVRGDGKGDNVLAHAAALAQRFKAHVTITHCRARAEDLMPYGVPIPAFLKQQIIDHTATLADQVEDGMQAAVRALAGTLKLEMTENPEGKAATASWVEEPGRQVDVIKRHGRLADLICVAKPDVDRNLGTNSLKAALFHTGRPVIMCPHNDDVPDELGNCLAIAWNGSIEAARAVALSLPLIEHADKITILTAGREASGASADDLASYLHLRGIDSTVNRFEPRRVVGLDLLKHAKEAGTNLLIMGAYGDSHEKETMFGGNTQYIVDNAEMPVVLVH